MKNATTTTCNMLLLHCCVLPAARNMQPHHATSKMQDETYKMQQRHAACNTRHAAGNAGLRGGRGVHDAQATRSAQHAKRSNKLREERNVQQQRPPCRKQHATRTVRHATRTIHQCSMQQCNMQRQWVPATSSMQHIYGGGEGTTVGLLLRLPVSGCGCVRRCKHRQLTLGGGSQLKRGRAGV